jgi:histidinol-phosphate/aromatic aminotransferase/cobyric acid decarboxylase-like protein
MSAGVSMKAPLTKRLRLSLANAAERELIAKARHTVYVTELKQYTVRPGERLAEPNGVESVYIGAWIDDGLAGFIAVTPPSSPRFSLEKHVPLADLAFARDAGVYEIRALTVLGPARGTAAAAALMYAALRFVQDAGGTHVVAVGRREVLDMYLRFGFEKSNISFGSGATAYEVIVAPVERIAAHIDRHEAHLTQLESRIDWRLEYGFRAPSVCYHGGAFFEAIGETFDDLDRRHAVIAADVLDAWYPPAPAVLDALREHTEWLARTSPPTQANGLTRVIADARGVDEACVLPGGGSSQLIFLALQTLLDRSSRVLILEPAYGEYAHVLTHVVGCRVERFALDRSRDYRVDLDALSHKLRGGFDWLIVVNPNNPTGTHVPRADLERFVESLPPGVRVWIDETYVEYAGTDQSLERFATCNTNTIVCKSMSKIYALSGLRVGYLCGPRQLIARLRPLLPPWSVSLPAQLAATRALQSPDYYADRISETVALRAELVQNVRALGIDEVVPGIGNFVMFHLPPLAADAQTIVAACREAGLYLRIVGQSGAIRIAVKDRAANTRMAAILEHATAAPRRVLSRK